MLQKEKQQPVDKLQKINLKKLNIKLTSNPKTAKPSENRNTFL